jgi:hypothetical protein
MMVWNANQQPPREVMSAMVTAWWISHTIRTMATFNLADHLADGPRTTAELALAMGTHEPTLGRFLRTLTGLGLCAAVDDGSVRLTALGELLRSDIPGSMRPYAMAMAAPYVMRAWEELPGAIQTGEAAFPRAHALSFWDYLVANPEEGATFDGAMSGAVVVRAHSLLSAMDLDGVDTLVDVGGGQGRMLATLLAATPGLRGILFDQPQVLDGAAEVLTTAGVNDRCELVGGDFFEAVPVGGDVYALAMIIHDWPDAEAIQILRTCHRAMGAGGRLWLIEQVIDAGDGYQRAKLLDLHMLVLFGAQERTAEEYRALLAAAGFGQITVHPTGTPYSVVEAVRS